MKKFYKLALALAITASTATAFALGTAEPSIIQTIGQNGNDIVYNVVNGVITVTGAEGEVIVVTSINGQSETGIVTNGEFATKFTGYVVAQVSGVVETLFIGK